jgi:hypothetical protein
MRTPTKTHIELSDLEGYEHAQVLLSGHNKANKKLSIKTTIDGLGELYVILVLEWNGADYMYLTIDDLPDAITKYNELI